MFVDRPPRDPDDPGATVFVRLGDTVGRCIEAGRFHPGDGDEPRHWAAEIWTTLHGMVTLAHAGVVPAEQVAVLLADTTYRLAVGYGDDRETAATSVARAPRNRRGSRPANNA